MLKRIAAVLVIISAFAAPFCSFAYESYTPGSVRDAVEGVVAYKSSALGADTTDELLEALGSDAGSYYSDWYIIALSRYGVNIDGKKCMSSLLNSLKELYSDGLERVKVTDLQRIAFVLLACGRDITDVGGRNLLADCTYDRALTKPLDSQGVNSVAYALLLLDSKNFKVPSTAAQDRNDMIRLILGAELENGGYALFGNAPDIDVTTIVLQALAPYVDHEDVRLAVNRGLGILSGRQDSCGAYKSFAKEVCAESTAQVILALTALDIDPISDSRFIKNSVSVMDGLMLFRKESGGFCHFLGNSEDNMASYQSLMALVAVYRMMKGENSFYDFSKMPSTGEVPTEPTAAEQKQASEKKSKSSKVTSYSSNLENKHYSKPTEKAKQSDTQSNSSHKKSIAKPSGKKRETVTATAPASNAVTTATASSAIPEQPTVLSKKNDLPEKKVSFGDAAVIALIYFGVVFIRKRGETE